MLVYDNGWRFGAGFTFHGNDGKKRAVKYGIGLYGPDLVRDMMRESLLLDKDELESIIQEYHNEHKNK